MSASQGIKPILCGDLVPRIRLPGLNGGEIDLYHPRIAGSPVVLWLTEQRPEIATLNTDTRRSNKFAAVEARLFNLVSGADAPEEETKEVPGLVQMFDPGRRLANLGLAGEGIAVIGPDRRLAGMLEGEDFDGALRLCQGLHARTERTVVAA